MFHIIPISSELTISATPLGAKSIRHLYFENKNDGLFRFKTSPDTISISVDGKQICRDLLVLPFCTSSPYSPDRFPWQKVALEVNVNCNLSEIRIQSSALGDFNVIMVCSDEGCREKIESGDDGCEVAEDKAAGEVAEVAEGKVSENGEADEVGEGKVSETGEETKQEGEDGNR